MCILLRAFGQAAERFTVNKAPREQPQTTHLHEMRLPEHSACDDWLAFAAMVNVMVGMIAQQVQIVSLAGTPRRRAKMQQNE